MASYLEGLLSRTICNTTETKAEPQKGKNICVDGDRWTAVSGGERKYRVEKEASKVHIKKEVVTTGKQGSSVL